MARAIATAARRLAVAAALLPSLAAAAQAAVPANYAVTGTFDDGGTLAGGFKVDVYGFLSGFDLTTTGGSTLGGFTYASGLPSSIDSPAGIVDFFSGNYALDLHLVFSGPLDAGADVSLVDAASFECAAYTCPGPAGAGGDTRYLIASTTTKVPEPAALALLAAGLLGIAAARRRV